MSSPTHSLSAVSFDHLRPGNLVGALFVVGCSALTALSLALAASDLLALWVVGQVLLAFALLQWFVLLHEAGHNLLFRTRRLNRLAGHVAGFFSVIPFPCWKIVHGMHHRWTGWQDLDMTTATLVPRPLSRLERAVVNVCWRCWIPLFSVLYRVNNFWNLPRLRRYFTRREQRRQFALGIVFLLAAYGVTAYLVGPLRLLQLAGPGLLLCLVMQDPLILSQHTHVPLKLSGGAEVAPFAPRQQEVFTRSLRFPRWFSALVLLHFDAHELHHMYPRVPGYYLSRIGLVTHNEVPWWQWLRRAKRVPGAVFLFQNRDQSGYDV
jgi:fatty acid desaturase